MVGFTLEEEVNRALPTIVSDATDSEYYHVFIDIFNSVHDLNSTRLLDIAQLPITEKRLLSGNIRHFAQTANEMDKNFLRSYTSSIITRLKIFNYDKYGTYDAEKIYSFLQVRENCILPIGRNPNTLMIERQLQACIGIICGRLEYIASNQ